MPRPFRRRTAAGASDDTYVVSADAVPFLSKFPSGRTVGMAIGAGRVALGTTFLSVPVTSLRIMGLDTGTATRVVWLARMTAARDVVLGAGTVCSSTRGGENSPWLIAGALSDAADTAFVVAGLRARRLAGIGAVGMAAAGAVTAIVGVWAAIESVRRG